MRVEVRGECRGKLIASPEAPVNLTVTGWPKKGETLDVRRLATWTIGVEAKSLLIEPSLLHCFRDKSTEFVTPQPLLNRSQGWPGTAHTGPAS